MRRLLWLGWWSLVFGLVVGCRGTPTPTPSGPTPTLTALPRPSATPSTTPVPTVRPSATATSTPSPVPTPTAIDFGLPAGDTYGILAAVVDHRRGWLYVLGRRGDASPDGNVLSVVDLARGEVRATAPLPGRFDADTVAALSADGRRLYIAGGDEPMLLVVRTGAEGALGAVVTTLPGVRAMALDAEAERLYVVDGWRLRRLNARTLEEELAVPLPTAPSALARPQLAVNPRAGRIFLTSVRSQWITVLRADDLQRVSDIYAGLEIAGLRPDPQRDQTYVLLEQDGEVRRVGVIRGDVVASFWNAPRDLRIRHLVTDGETGDVLLVEHDAVGGAQVRVIDPDTGETQRTVAVPATEMVAALAYQGRLYRLSWDGVLVSVGLDSGATAPPLYLGIGLTSLALDEAAKRLFVLDWTGTLHVLDTATRRETATWKRVLDPGLGVIRHAPLAVAGGRLYVPDFARDTTLVLDASTGKRLAQIPKAGQITVDLRRNRLFVTRQGVYVVDGRTFEVTGAIDETVRKRLLSGEPGAIAARYDPSRDLLFVTMSNNVPGSGARTWLQIYDGENLTRVETDVGADQRFLLGWAIEPDADRVWLADGVPGHELAVFDLDGRLVARLRGVAGTLFLDPPRERVYVWDWGGLVTVDRTSFDVVDFRPLDLPSLQAAVLDPRRGSLYVARLDDATLRILDLEAPPEVQTEAVEALPTVAVRYLAVDTDGTQFVVNAVGELFQGRDGRWLRIRNALPGVGRPRVVRAPGAVGTLFAFADPRWPPFGLFRSTDGGRTWQPVNRGLRDLMVRDLALSPDFSADGRALLLAGESGVFETRDGGERWARLAAVVGDRIAVASSPSGALTFLLLARDRTTAGQTVVYAPVGAPGTVEPIGTIPAGISSALALSPNFAADGTALAAMGQDGLFLTEDGGRNWTPAGPPVGLASPVYTVLFSPSFAPDRTVYVLIAPGHFGVEDTSLLLRSTDGGRTWERATDANPRLSALALAPNGELWGGDAEGRVERLDPARLTWEPVGR